MTGQAPSLPAETTVGQVCLQVATLEPVVEFYETVVGLEALERSADRALLGVDGQGLLALRAAPDRPERAPDEAGLFHTAIRVPSREALSDALARIEDAAALTGASDHLVSEALYLEDPAGNGVEIYRDRAREDWPTEPDGSVRIDTLGLDLEALRGAGTGTETVPVGTNVGHVNLEVSSLAAAREFYVDSLGFGVQNASGRNSLFLAAGDYHHHLGLNTWNRRTAPATGLGLDWFELVVPTAGDLRELEQRLGNTERSVECTAAGLTVVGPDRIRLKLTIRDGESA